MKDLLFINVLLLAVVLNGCTQEKSVAAAYKEGAGKGSADVEGDAGDDSLGDEGDEGGGEGDEGGGEGDEGGGEGDEGGGAVDAAAGLAIIDGTCKACHNADAGAAAKGVPLNAAAIDRLDTAYTGAQKAFHGSFSEAFEAPGRANLEAALKGIK